MCIAILNSSGYTLFKQTILNCWSRNKDGAGMMYALDGKLNVYKSLSKKKFIKEYFNVRKKYPEINIVLHFRYATHGGNNLVNTHPHLVNDNLGLVHNGIIDSVVYDNETDVETFDKVAKRMLRTTVFTSDKSDSLLFAEMLGNLPKDFLKQEVFVELIRNYIENDNKLIFLDNCGEYKIINENKGIWNSGCWFSNSGYLKKEEIKWEKIKSTPHIQNNLFEEVDDPYDVKNLQKSEVRKNENDDGCCQVKNNFTYGNEDDPICEYCFSPLYGVNEMRNKTCHNCFTFYAEL